MQIEGMLMEIIAFGFLCICAVFDIRRKEIPTVLIGIGFAGAFFINVWGIISGTISFIEIGLCLLPGIFFSLTSFCTKEKVGFGDGLMLLIAGLLIGFYRCFFVLCISLIFSSFFSLVLLLLRRVGKESRIPFAPFLVIGMGVGLFV